MKSNLNVKPKMRTRGMDLNESEMDLNECEMDLNECEMDLNESEMDLNECEMDLNECEHFLKVNLDQSKIDQSLIDFNVDGLSFCWWCCCCCTNRRCAVLDVQF